VSKTDGNERTHHEHLKSEERRARERRRERRRERELSMNWV
jgi:hypothetical protein